MGEITNTQATRRAAAPNFLVGRNNSPGSQVRILVVIKFSSSLAASCRLRSRNHSIDTDSSPRTPTSLRDCQLVVIRCLALDLPWRSGIGTRNESRPSRNNSSQARSLIRRQLILIFARLLHATENGRCLIDAHGLLRASLAIPIYRGSSGLILRFISSRTNRPPHEASPTATDIAIRHQFANGSNDGVPVQKQAERADCLGRLTPCDSKYSYI